MGELALSFLAAFWAAAADLRPAVVLVHRDPRSVLAAAVSNSDDVEDRLDWWDRCNRSALILCSAFPSLVVNYDDLVGRPKSVLTEIVEFLGDLGVTVDTDVGHAAAQLETLVPGPQLPEAPTNIDNNHLILNRILDQLDGHRGEQIADKDSLAELTRVTADFYDENYYEHAYDKRGVPYSRSEASWVDFFDLVADSIVKTLRPDCALDVGCAIGLLVEGLRSRGVDARGVDISTWAIDQVPEHLRSYCEVGSVTEELRGHYDLITCIEVLEHLPPSLAEFAVANLCRHAQTVLFSSTPDEFEEPTHLNVEPSNYWAGLFFENGFVRDFEYDASFLSLHASVFRRRSVDVEGLVRGYERALFLTSSTIEAVFAMRSMNMIAWPVGTTTWEPRTRS